MRRDRGICHVCGQPGADQVDHVIPVAEGGPDTVDDKAPIHARPCHIAKTAEESRRGRARRRGLSAGNS
ncbi:MAG TPA: HNH endonuclease [Acidimicrobiales bacterium]|nr:HNH endonuclease [Acidimicrobiales bacterium]